MADSKLLQQVIPAGLLEDRQVAKVVLQPTSLRLNKRKKSILKVVCCRAERRWKHLDQGTMFNSPEQLSSRVHREM